MHCYTQNIKGLGLVVLEKFFYIFFSHCKYIGTNASPGGLQVA